MDQSGIASSGYPVSGTNGYTPVKPKSAAFWIILIIFMIIFIALVIWFIWYEFFRAKPSGGHCTSDSQCATNLTCSNNQCVPKNGVGDACTQQTDCAGGVTGQIVCCANLNATGNTQSNKSGVCSLQGTPTAVALNNDESTSWCGNGITFKPGGCTNDQDCEVGLSCQTNTNTSNNTTYPKTCQALPTLRSCTSDQECNQSTTNANPQYCPASLGTCLAGTGSAGNQMCSWNPDCRTGHFCDPTNSRCYVDNTSTTLNGAVRVVNAGSISNQNLIYISSVVSDQYRLYVNTSTVRAPAPNNSSIDVTSALVPNVGSTDAIFFTYNPTEKTLQATVNNVTNWVYIKSDGTLGITASAPPAPPSAANSTNDQLAVHPRGAYTIYGWVLYRNTSPAQTALLFFTDDKGNKLMASSSTFVLTTTTSTVDQGNRAIGFYNPSSYPGGVIPSGSPIAFFEYNIPVST